MDYFKKMLDLAKQIKDKELREKTIEILRNPKMMNDKFPYMGLPMKDAPASLGFHHVHRGGLAKHTYIVARMCLDMSDVIEDEYGIEVDRDVLVSGALLHDVAKLFDMKRDNGGFDATELSIDHVVMGSAELYARGFPEPVIHLIASHFGEQGTTSPHTVEALLLHHADTISAVIGTSKAHKLMQFLSR